jgi:2-polyprenyl-3-methyl-5-hydroxy-6-metoxy-1,4-benzoquinol methylase
MKALSDEKIIDSWNKNVSPWIEAIRKGEIASRVHTTNKAIIDAIKSCRPKTVLDIGCGEGWLVRELTKMGIDTQGVDVVPELINSAINEGGGKYKILSYEEVSYETLNEKYDVVVSNFALLGEQSVVNVFREISSILTKGGYFIIQTIHPINGGGEEEYIDGWREGTWKGFSKMFTDPAPWYFRTIDSWKALFEANGFSIEKINEPVNAETEVAASIVFVGRME